MDAGGILRKRTKFSPEDELLVFGYQCRLFRDDEKAQFIDQGKHLIPWMNDNSIRIDRYDVRATLNDLKLYEPPPGGYTNRLDYLSPAEQKAEQLCEEERYYSLYHNEREEEYQQEEELKRIQTSSYAQVSFNYDTPPATLLPKKQPSVEEEDEESFEPSPNFPIPADIELPPTVKLNAIIEKTARFIASQGAQMEILIKTKQANNPQFEFLTQNGRYNRYYKFILVAIKENRYPSAELDAKPSDGTTTDELKNVPKVLQNEEYAVAASQKILPVIKYKPSADCAYTQLISKITGAPLPAQVEDVVEDSEVAPPEPIMIVSIASTSNGSSVQGATAPPPLADNERVDFKRKAESVEVKKISTGLMLAQCYNSDSEEDDDSNSGNSLFKFDLPVPPDGLQHIIDKTAAYVAKNGKDFEDILRTKQDPRFSFLDDSSEYHRYYIYKVTGSIYLPSSVSNGDVQQSTKKEETQKTSKDEPKAVTPVCFSIKAKDDPQVPMKPVLPQEPSSDEENAEKNDIQPEVGEPSVEEDDTNRDLGINVEEILEIEEKKEAKRAEEKVRDKLAAAAREKLGLISKEKQLQLERKKKAMAFLTQIKSSGLVKPPPSATITTSVVVPSAGIPTTSVGNGQQEDSDTDVSIHSLPHTAVEMPRERSRSQSRSSRKRRTRSRSRTSSESSRSRSSRRRSVSVKRKKKKSKQERSKKKSKRKSRSRSSERKHKKKSSRRRSEERYR